jgi:hypothetical protein
MIYAGIGSTKTPDDIQKLFIKIGYELAIRGEKLRSGAAKSADKAFEKGCDLGRGKKEIYLPWKKFEGSSSKLIVSNKEAFNIGAKYHPRWNKLTDAAQLLQARNSHQVLGWELDEPCDFIVCWTEGGKLKGGTSQALRIAKDYDIPIFNFGDYKDIEKAKKEFNKFYKKVSVGE